LTISSCFYSETCRASGVPSPPALRTTWPSEILGPTNETLTELSSIVSRCVFIVWFRPNNLIFLNWLFIINRWNVFWLNLDWLFIYIYKRLRPKKKNPQQKKERATETFFLMKLNTKPLKFKCGLADREGGGRAGRPMQGLGTPT
jgi:hypothetical protein